MRYVLKFNNGTWKTFDTHRYGDVCPHETQKAGLAYVAKLNARA
jgi:hypothetical protein